MVKFKSKNIFLTLCVCSIFLVLGMVYVSFDSMLKGTNAAFGNVTGSLVLPSEIKYYSNFPDDLEDLISTDTGRKEYLILDNMFEVPLGYVFVGWNTKSDGTGDIHKYNDQIYVTAPVELYAQWVKQEEDNKDEMVVSYGDVNFNNVIDEEDYVLVENYVYYSVVLEENALKNADVNQDGVVDLIDADIIKQAFLGTEGYTGYFPGLPILKYEIYEEKEGDVENPGDGNNNGSGNNNQGNGSSSNGGANGGGYKPSGGNGNTNNGVNADKGNNSNVDKDDEKDNVDLDNKVDNGKKEYYEFRYLVNDVVFLTTRCNNMVSGKCDLILPKNDPLKDGYIFLGWSEKSDCSTDTIVINSILVDNDKNYYACFVEDNKKKDNSKKANIWVIVISIWVLAITLIYHVVKYYKKRKDLN